MKTFLIPNSRKVFVVDGVEEEALNLGFRCRGSEEKLFKNTFDFVFSPMRALPDVVERVNKVIEFELEVGNQWVSLVDEAVSGAAGCRIHVDRVLELKKMVDRHPSTHREHDGWVEGVGYNLGKSAQLEWCCEAIDSRIVRRWLREAKLREVLSNLYCKLMDEYVRNLPHDVLNENYDFLCKIYHGKGGLLEVLRR